MFNRIPMLPTLDWARGLVSVIHSMSAPSSGGLALACLLLTGCASAGGSSPLSSQGSSSSPADPASASAAAVKPENTLAEAISVSPVVLQRRRQAIAQMLESNVAFRGILLEHEAPKISDAKLAGPFEHRQRKFLFSSEIITRTLYCATAGVGIGSLPRVWRIALIEVFQVGKGSERLVAKVPMRYSPPECGSAKYEPFPELEQARAQRRRALGMVD